MAEVVWTRRALADIEAIRNYIGQFSPLAAQSIALRLLSAGDSLDKHPDRGRTIGGKRQELTTVPPYLLRYRHKKGRVEIITIRHGARKPE